MMRYTTGARVASFLRRPPCPRRSVAMLRHTGFRLALAFALGVPAIAASQARSDESPLTVRTPPASSIATLALPEHVSEEDLADPAVRQHLVDQAAAAHPAGDFILMLRRPDGSFVL